MYILYNYLHAWKPISPHTYPFANEKIPPDERDFL